MTSFLRRRDLWPIFGLLAVQLLTGMRLIRSNSVINHRSVGPGISASGDDDIQFEMIDGIFGLPFPT